MKHHVAKVASICHNSPGATACDGDVKTGLLQYSIGRSATGNRSTTTTSPELRCSLDLRTEHWWTCVLHRIYHAAGASSSNYFAASYALSVLRDVFMSVSDERYWVRRCRTDRFPAFARPRLRTKLGEHASSDVGPAAWNALPEDLRAMVDNCISRD